MNDLRKDVLINNFKNSLKYKIKNNNDIIDLLFDEFDYCNREDKNYYLNKIDKYEKINKNILKLLKTIYY